MSVARQESRRAPPLNQRHEDDPASPRLDEICANDLLLGIVPALDQDVRTSRLDQVQRRILIEQYNRIDAGEARDYLGPVALGDDRADSPFRARTERSVFRPTISLVPRAGASEQGDVAYVEQVIATVCEDDSLAAGPPVGDPPQEGLERVHLVEMCGNLIGPKSVEELAALDRCGADLSHDDPRGHVGQRERHRTPSRQRFRR